MPSHELWEQFTDASTRVIHYAQEEAKHWGVAVVDTEHLLLGMIRGDEGIAGDVLRKFDVNQEKARHELANQMEQPKEKWNPSKKLSLSSTGKQALEAAISEARTINPNYGRPFYIDTEHLLLGLLDAGPSCKGCAILAKLGADLERMRSEVLACMAIPHESQINGATMKFVG